MLTFASQWSVEFDRWAAEGGLASLPVLAVLTARVTELYKKP